MIDGTRTGTVGSRIGRAAVDIPLAAAQTLPSEGGEITRLKGFLDGTYIEQFHTTQRVTQCVKKILHLNAGVVGNLARSSEGGCHQSSLSGRNDAHSITSLAEVEVGGTAEKLQASITGIGRTDVFDANKELSVATRIDYIHRPKL